MTVEQQQQQHGSRKERTLRRPPYRAGNNSSWAQFASTFLERLQCCSTTTIDLHVADETDDSIYHCTNDDNQAADDDAVNNGTWEDDNILLDSSTRQPHSSTASVGLPVPLRYTPNGGDRRLVQRGHPTTSQDLFRYSHGPSKKQANFAVPPTESSTPTESKKHVDIRDPHRPENRNSRSPFTIHHNNIIGDGTCCGGPQDGATTPPVVPKFPTMGHSKPPLYTTTFTNEYTDSIAGTAPTLLLDDEEEEEEEEEEEDGQQQEEEIGSSATTQVVSHRTMNFYPTTTTTTAPLWISQAGQEERQDQEEEQAYRSLMRMERPYKIRR